MKNNLRNTILPAIALVLMAALLPTKDFAQRFNHANFSAPRPPQNFSRPAAPPPAPRPMTINGGNRNFGNHDFNRAPVAAPPRPNVTVHENVNVHRDVHENVNVYHTGGYRGMRPYAYHPYHPFYWGPRWHPVGFFLNALAANAIRFSFANQYYYYDDGVYYVPYNGGYSVVPPPVGAGVSYLPDGYETVPVGNDTYYYYAGTFYVFDGQTYQIVQAPIGAVISQLPDGATQQDINGDTYLVYNNTYYLPISMNGQDAYQVAQVN